MKYNITYLIFFSFLVIFSLTILGTKPDEKFSFSTKNEKSIAKPAAVVEMTNTLKFSPDTVRIKKGQTVLWKNSSLLVHSVTADPSKSTIKGSMQLPSGAKPFNSGLMDPDETFKRTFKTAGTYQYFCIPHEATKMYGWVIVE